MPWRSDREIARLTAEIRSLDREVSTFMADHLVEIGARLQRIRARIRDGNWREWLAQSVPFDRSSADNYMKLATWAADEPREFRRLRGLGPGKLYVIMSLDPPRRRALRPEQLIALPDGRRRSLEVMTKREVEDHFRLDLAIERPRRQPIGKVVQGYRHEIASLRARNPELAQRRAEIDDETAQQLHDEGAAMLDELDAALGL
jgi:hypothetical protein